MMHLLLFPCIYQAVDLLGIRHMFELRCNVSIGRVVAMLNGYLISKCQQRTISLHPPPSIVAESH